MFEFKLKKQLIMKKLLLSITIIFSIQINSLFSKENLEEKPKGFVENKGQVLDQNFELNSDVAYLLLTEGINIQLRKNGFSYDTYSDISSELSNSETQFHRVDIEFLNANAYSEIETFEKSKDYSNYYNDIYSNNAITKVHHYKKIVFKNLYNNIDVEFLSNLSNKTFEYNFIVHPGGNVEDIKLQYNGANVSLEENKLVFDLNHGNMEEVIPDSWVENKNKKEKINAFYTYLGNNTFGFSTPLVAQISNGEILVIDPMPVRHWGTYYGGNGREVVSSVSTDLLGNVYIAGNTSSTNNIATAGVHQTTLASNFTIAADAFVAKLDATGNRIWGTYYGGTFGGSSDYDTSSGEDIAVDSNGNVYLAGFTMSPNSIATIGAHQETLMGGRDAMLIKFSNDGLRIWGTYYGGSNTEYGYGIAIDNNDKVYLAGWSQSTDGIGTAGTHQGTSPNRAAFIAKFNPNGNREWGTYFGGTGGTTEGYGIATDSQNNIYLTGKTLATASIATNNAHQTNRASSSSASDAFIVKFNDSGTRLWSSYYGGTGGSTTAYSVDVDINLNVYIAGITTVNNGISTPNTHQENIKGANDTFIAKFNAIGQRQWGTYYGGDGSETPGSAWTVSLCTDNIGKVVYLSGSTSSKTDIATENTYQEIINTDSTQNTYDAFLVQMMAEDGTREWGTYIGGTSNEGANKIDIDNVGRIYLVGWTNSNNNISTAGTHQTTITNVNTEGFLLRLGTITADAGLDTAFCFGDTIQIGGSPSAYGSDSPFTYTWNPATGLNNPNAANPLASPLVTTEYILTVTNGEQLTDIDTVLITVLPLPIANAGNDEEICDGSTTTLNGSGGVIFEWTPSTALDNPNIANPTTNTTQNITYILTVTDTNTCKNTDAVSINVLPLPSAPSLSSDTAYCLGDTITALVAQGLGNNINWYDDADLTNLLVSNSSYTPSPILGENVYYATDVLNGCEGLADSVKIMLNDLPNAGFTANHTSLTLNFTPNISGMPTYSWDFGDGNTSFDENPSNTFASEATYTISLLVIDNNGCENTSNQNIEVLATNTNNVFNSQNIHLYPNPTKNFINIDLDQNISKINISITDLYGKTVFNQDFENMSNEKINLEGFANGIYTLRITDAELNSFNYKVIKN
jgi:PKD repeat protein